MNEVILNNKKIEVLYRSLKGINFNKLCNNKNIKKENDNVEEKYNVEGKLSKFLEENDIPVNDNDEFVVYVVVDADDKDHEVGAIIYKENTETYTESRAYEDLNNNKHLCYGVSTSNFMIPLYTEILNQTKKTSIREDLLKVEDKMFAVIANKKDVSDVADDIVYINKYKVITEVDLNPTLKYKIKSISDKTVDVILYNNLTEKSKTITLRNVSANSLDGIGEAIRDYLTTNEIQVELINSTVDDGIEL